ncbi:MAG: hypothetical protein ER33_04820 [Cyanobium sp. CACIAM 14]|nr:MAG: hypothetical protein ER33_04820 [Cyanobium sp. CACIAM 14]
MQDLTGVLATAVSAFAASNLDDILVLLLLFSAADRRHAAWHVVAGQYLGFAVLVCASLIGFVGGQLLPPAWIGVLGLLPISLGVSQLIDNIGDADDSVVSTAEASMPTWLLNLGLPCGQIAAIAGLTVANGGDNVGLYLPLFAGCTAPELGLTLLVFAGMVGLWCALAWRLIQAPGLGALVRRVVQPAVPLVLIGLGLLILLDSHTLADRTLAVLVLCGLAAMSLSLGRQLQQAAQSLHRATLRPTSVPSR